MKYAIFIFCITLGCASCNNPSTDNQQNASTDTSSFTTIADDYISGYLAWRPLQAVNLGFHDYDGKTTDYSKASLDKELSRLHSFQDKLSGLDTTKLSDKDWYDYRILRAAIGSEIFSFENMKSYTHNPMAYAGAVDVSIYVKRDFAPLADRVKDLIATEQTIPALFVAAKENLEDSLPKPFIETAVQIAQGNAAFMKGDLLIALKDVKDDTLMKAFTIANDSAVAAYNGFITWLQKEKLPKSNNSYAIGRDNYKKMLLIDEGITMEPEQILAIGLQELKKEQDRFNVAAKIINPNAKPIDVHEAIQKEHPSADSLIPTAKQHLEAIRQFLLDKNICSIPSDVRVQVKETPQFARATSTASMDVVGPFEKKATESYYYITPVDATWNAKQKEDWLRQFDYYTTDNITVHEAYPGHYTQFLHLNASSATKIEKLFGNYAYIEGWAHYCEQMMTEQGFGNNGDSVTAAKYRLAQSGDALLRLCRLCNSIKIHCEGSSVEDGTKFFMANWYQGEKPSYQESLRGSFDPGYLFYTLGKLEILKLRNDYQQQEGSHYSLKDFNDKMMDNGMPPVRLLRERLLKDKKAWDAIL